MKKFLILTFLIFLTLGIAAILITTEVNTPPEEETKNCTPLQKSFDDAVERSRLSIPDNPDSLCFGLNMSSDFSSLPPKWGVGELIAKDDNSLTFKGLSQQNMFPLLQGQKGGQQYTIGKNYKIDMNNICRNFFMLADSRAPSPIVETFVEPEEINCPKS